MWKDIDNQTGNNAMKDFSVYAIEETYDCADGDSKTEKSFQFSLEPFSSTPSISAKVRLPTGATAYFRVFLSTCLLVKPFRLYHVDFTIPPTTGPTINLLFAPRDYLTFLAWSSNLMSLDFLCLIHSARRLITP